MLHGIQFAVFGDGWRLDDTDSRLGAGFRFGDWSIGNLWLKDRWRGCGFRFIGRVRFILSGLLLDQTLDGWRQRLPNKVPGFAPGAPPAAMEFDLSSKLNEIAQELNLTAVMDVYI